jgi:hypothetical protein
VNLNVLLNSEMKHLFSTLEADDRRHKRSRKRRGIASMLAKVAGLSILAPEDESEISNQDGWSAL